MGVKVFRITRQTILAAELRKLAGHEGQHQGAAVIDQRRIKGAVRTVNASADRPAPGQLVVGRRIKAECALEAGAGKGRTGNRSADGNAGLALLPPDEFAAGDERVIDG